MKYKYLVEEYKKLTASYILALDETTLFDRLRIKELYKNIEFRENIIKDLRSRLNYLKDIKYLESEKGIIFDFKTKKFSKKIKKNKK